MLDEVEQRLLRPVEVVEHADERLHLRLLFEELAEPPRDLLRRGRRVRLAEQRAQRPPSISTRQRAELLEDLHHRPVRDPFSVGKAAAAYDPGVQTGKELGCQPRLADPGRAEDGEELATAVADGLVEDGAQAQ